MDRLQCTVSPLQSTEPSVHLFLLCVAVDSSMCNFNLERQLMINQVNKNIVQNMLYNNYGIVSYGCFLWDLKSPSHPLVSFPRLWPAWLAAPWCGAFPSSLVLCGVAPHLFWWKYWTQKFSSDLSFKVLYLEHGKSRMWLHYFQNFSMESSTLPRNSHNAR